MIFVDAIANHVIVHSSFYHTFSHAFSVASHADNREVVREVVRETVMQNARYLLRLAQPASDLTRHSSSCSSGTLLGVDTVKL